MPVIDAVVQSVEARVVNRKSDGKSITIYEIHGDGKKIVTSRRDLAGEANGVVGRLARIYYKTEMNGVYENHYLEDIQPLNGNEPPLLPQPTFAPPEPVREAPSAPQAIPNREEAIHRQTAAKVSARISTNPGEFWSNLDALVHYFATGQKPSPVTSNGATQSVTSTGNQFIPPAAIAAEAAATDGYQYGDTDIPFD